MAINHILSTLLAFGVLYLAIYLLVLPKRSVQSRIGTLALVSFFVMIIDSAQGMAPLENYVRAILSSVFFFILATTWVLLVAKNPDSWPVVESDE